LGRAIVDPGAATGDSNVPAIYTYFGQFVDHDITLESGSFTTAQLVSSTLAPLPLARIRDDLKNLRTATLELDSLYGPPAPRAFPNLNKMLIGKVTSLGGTEAPSLRPTGKGDDNDLPQGAAQPRLPPRPGVPDRRPPQRREPDHRPAAPGLPQGPQPPGRPGPHLRPGA